MPPEPGQRVEAVVRQELPAVLRHEVHRSNDVAKDLLGDEVVEAHPDPAGLDPLTAMRDFALELVRTVKIDPQQPVAIRPGARAPATGLNSEQIVENGDHKVVVEIAA